MKPAMLLAAAPLCLVALGAGAQELTLFEATQGNEEEERQTPVRREPVAQQQPGQPTFTLRGTSRFGDDYNVYLKRGREGENAQSITVDWTRDAAAGIPGYSGYQVVGVNARGASIRLPNGTQCYAFPDQGVECDAEGRMLLSLETAQPLETPEPEPEQGGNRRNEIINPFTGEAQEVPQLSEEEREARAQRQRARAERLRNFQPVRIPDREVPEGMRKVSTPFGDRLVPENE